MYPGLSGRVSPESKEEDWGWESWPTPEIPVLRRLRQSKGWGWSSSVDHLKEDPNTEKGKHGRRSEKGRGGWKKGREGRRKGDWKPMHLSYLIPRLALLVLHCVLGILGYQGC